MSAFSPLNLVEDASKKDLEEEHTREIEIENAFKVYQEAIALQNQGLLTDSYKKYKELANSNVIINHYYEELHYIRGIQNAGSTVQSDDLSYLPQNVKSIRFLYFRNKAFLNFRILKAGEEGINDALEAEYKEENEAARMSFFDFQKDLFYNVVDGLVTCLMYQEADESMLRLLFDIYSYLEIRKLARFTLEYSLSFSNESDDIYNHLCLNEWARPLWERYIEDDGSNLCSAKLEEKFSFLRPLKDDFISQLKSKRQPSVLKVSVKFGSLWCDVIQAINSALKENQNKEKTQEFSKITVKHFDPYLTSDTTLDKIEFSFVDAENADVEESPSTESNANEEKQPTIASDVNNGNDSSNEVAEEVPGLSAEPSIIAEKSTMRLSKRLNPGDSRPVDADNIVLSRRYFIETETFFDLLNDSMSSIFGSNHPVFNDIIDSVISDSDLDDPLYIRDFVTTLNEWKPKVYSDALFAESKSAPETKTQSDRKNLIEVLTTFGNKLTSSIHNPEAFEDSEDPEYVKSFLSSQIKPTPQLNEAKLSILRHLLCSIASTAWSSSLYQAVSDWALELEAQILHQCEWKDFDDKQLYISLAVGIYEILINNYINSKEALEQSIQSGAHNHFLKSIKSNFNSSAIELLRLKDRISRWSSVLSGILLKDGEVKDISESELQFVVRYLWTSNYYTASNSSSWREKKYVVVQLHQLSVILNSLQVSDVHILFPNYSAIGHFSFESLHRRLSTASILSIFSKILDGSSSELNSTNETISLLESILINQKHENGSLDSEITMIDRNPSESSSLVNSVIHGLAVLDKASLNSVKEFFNECPVDLKLNLWNILFSYYQKDSLSNFQHGLEQFLQFLFDYMNADNYKNHKEDRSVLLLTLLAAYRGHLLEFLDQLSKNKWTLSDEFDNQALTNLAKLFEVCYCFSLHEESALITSRKISLATKAESCYQYFKDYFIDVITTITIYCVHYMKKHEVLGSNIAEFLTFIHHQLGLRRLCDSSKGLFLKFSEDTLVSLSDIPEKELTQIMSCRYHYKVKLNGQFPVDHYTVKSADLDANSAEELAAFILPLCFKKNPLTQNPRNDLKQVVEDLFEKIGDPNLESDDALVENVAMFEKFLDQTTLGPRFIKEAFYGLRSLSFLDPKTQQKSASEGLYFLEAILMFNFYKIRKKSAQSRTVELERINTLLMYDLIFGSNRAESWILLGQSFSFIVEDDLIWTSDKLNIVDRKVVTANLQRKSLICFMMAVSTITRNQNESKNMLRPVIAVLMNSFARELYSAAKDPMGMIAFKVHNNSRFVKKKNETMYLMVAEKPCISFKFCLTLMHRCLEIAVKSNSEDWSSFYYLAKVKAELRMHPDEVLSVMSTAIDLAMKHSVASDPILEPLYRYYSLLYKFVKTKVLSTKTGIDYLKSDSVLQLDHEFESLDIKEFYHGVNLCLKKIISLDKKAWYHKPSYRLAMITLNEFDDVEGAEEIMSKYFTLKSNNKTFLQMWKPEHERAGKHFIYMYQYTRFYITLLSRQKDLSSLVLMFPKLRRANSTMISLYFAWDQMCSSLCNIVREVAWIDDNYVESFLNTTSHSHFVRQAKSVIEAVQSGEPSAQVQKLLALIHVITELRRLNNGFGPTSLIDDTFTALFVKVLKEYPSLAVSSSTVSTTDSPNGKVKRLAKRDFFPFTIELSTKCKRGTESLIKENPDLFNYYVAQYRQEKDIYDKRVFAEECRTQRYQAVKEIMQQQAKAMSQMLHASISKRTIITDNVSPDVIILDDPHTPPQGVFTVQSKTQIDPPSVYSTPQSAGLAYRPGPQVLMPQVLMVDSDADREHGRTNTILQSVISIDSNDSDISAPLESSPLRNEVRSNFKEDIGESKTRSTDDKFAVSSEFHQGPGSSNYVQINGLSTNLNTENVAKRSLDDHNHADGSNFKRQKE